MTSNRVHKKLNTGLIKDVMNDFDRSIAFSFGQRTYLLDKGENFAFCGSDGNIHSRFCSSIFRNTSMYSFVEGYCFSILELVVFKSERVVFQMIIKDTKQSFHVAECLIFISSYTIKIITYCF